MDDSHIRWAINALNDSGYQIKADIIFKPLSKYDLKLLHQWFHIPHVLKWYARSENYTYEMIQEKYLPRVNDKFIPNFIIYLKDEPIGYAQYYHVTHSLPEGIENYNNELFSQYEPNELVGVDFFIAEEKYLKGGYASQSLESFIDRYLKNKFKAILVDPHKDNKKAILFFERNGFKQTQYSHDINHIIMMKITERI